MVWWTKKSQPLDINICIKCGGVEFTSGSRCFCEAIDNLGIIKTCVKVNHALNNLASHVSPCELSTNIIRTEQIRNKYSYVSYLFGFVVDRSQQGDKWLASLFRAWFTLTHVFMLPRSSLASQKHREPEVSSIAFAFYADSYVPLVEKNNELTIKMKRVS